MLTWPATMMGGGAAVEAEYQFFTADIDLDGAQSKLFTAQDIGAAPTGTDTRHVLIIVFVSSGNTSCQIDTLRIRHGSGEPSGPGSWNNLTFVVSDRFVASSSSFNGKIGIIEWPTGTEIDVQAIMSHNSLTCGILVWTLGNLQSATPYDSDTDSSATEQPLAVSIDIQGGGALICGAWESFFFSTGWAWTGATEVENSTGYSGAQRTPEEAEAGHTVTAFPSNSNVMLLGASFS